MACQVYRRGRSDPYLWSIAHFCRSNRCYSDSFPLPLDHLQEMPSRYQTHSLHTTMSPITLSTDFVLHGRGDSIVQPSQNRGLTGKGKAGNSPLLPYRPIEERACLWGTDMSHYQGNVYKTASETSGFGPCEGVHPASVGVPSNPAPPCGLSTIHQCSSSSSSSSSSSRDTEEEEVSVATDTNDQMWATPEPHFCFIPETPYVGGGWLSIRIPQGVWLSLIFFSCVSFRAQTPLRACFIFRRLLRGNGAWHRCFVFRNFRPRMRSRFVPRFMALDASFIPESPSLVPWSLSPCRSAW